MARLSKVEVEAMNGGLFKKMMQGLLHFSDDAWEAMERKAARQARGVTRRRERYIGSTPSVSSSQAHEVFARMSREVPPAARTVAGEQQVLHNGSWIPRSECNMGHYPVDAVDYWNNTGRALGPQHPEVRRWMNDPDNYRLQHGPTNQRAGSELGASGVRYQAPINHLLDEFLGA